MSLKFSFDSPQGMLLLFPDSARVADPKTGAAYPGTRAAVTAWLNNYNDQLSQRPDVVSADIPPLTNVVKIDAVIGDIRRPNGEIYKPRNVVAGGLKMQDVAALRKAYDARIPVMFTGPPGTGKTALVEAALPNVQTIAGTGDTEVSDYIGSWVQNPDGTYTWVDGPLLIALENGWPLFVDEIALIDPRVNAVTYPVMDGRGELVVTANPARGTVQAKDGFYLVSACNPDVPGAILSDALLSRYLLKIEVLTDFGVAEDLGVTKEIVIVAKNLARKKENDDIIKAPQMRELLAFKKIQETFGLEMALANFIADAEFSDRAAYVEAISGTFGKKVDVLAIK